MRRLRGSARAPGGQRDCLAAGRASDSSPEPFPGGCRAFSNNQRWRRRLRPGTARRPPGAGEERPPVGAPRNVPVGGSCSRPGGQARRPGGGHFLERTASGGCERRCRRRPTLGPSQPATSGPHRPPPASAALVLPPPPPRRAPRTVRPLALPGLARPGAAAR